MRKCLEAEDLFTQMMNETMSEEELKELKRKRNRERQRAYYHRQKDLKQNEKKKEDRVPKSNAERQRAYYHRHKDSKKNEKKKKDRLPKSNAERQRIYRQRHAEKSYVDMLRQKLDSNEENVVQCRSVGNIENVTLQQNQFNSQQLQIYEQRYECITSEVTLHRNTGIPGDGNCLFHSLISVLQLQIETCELRAQLRDSPFLNYCHNPQEAYNILSSTNDYGDLDCLYLFSKSYNQNVCVHYCFYNISTTDQDTIFCHFKANDTKNWIHLYLREQHFTPLYEVKNEANDDSNIQLMRDNHDNKGSNMKQEDSIEDSHKNHEIEIEIDQIGENINDFIADGTVPVYTNYRKHSTSHIDFYKDFTSNSFGHSCKICDRLWWKRDLKMSTSKHENILKTMLQNYTPGETVQVCSTCYISLEKERIPLMSTYNGFAYPEIPSHLPKLNLIEQRLISPRIPFMEIRRLRHVYGQHGIYGQIINIPIEVNTMVKQLPRNIQDDLCFYVNLKKKLIHKISYVHGLINKSHIKDWLTYLVSTPLYTYHDIKIDDFLLTDNEPTLQLNMDEISEHVPIEDSLIAQQQTLLWNDDYFLSVAPGEHNKPVSILMDEHAEELSFPTIYGGQFRTYRDGITVTPFMQATSELRRTDRRATEPQHLLYIAAKIMKLRVSRCVNVAFKHVGQSTSITKETIQSEEYINNCLETNLSFLRCIPNSAWFWSDRKKDLFAMIRQLGPPTAFMTLSANETGWENLLKLLYKLKNEGTEISDEFLAEMSYMHKAQLVNEDAVTCAIYFNKMVNCLLKVLQSKKRSPFGKYRVVNYFQRVEFQHRGSTFAHILLWLENVPKDLISNDPEVIKLIDELVSVSASEASGNIKLVTHKHTLTCYKKMNLNKKRDCILGAPFMPTKKTIYLKPMRDTDPEYSEVLFKEYKKRFKIIRHNLENVDYTNFDEFYSHNDIISDEHYYNIIRAGINRPKLLYKRTPAEKWHNTFNPFVLHHLKSNMDFQIILDEYACATYVVEYFNQNNRGISNLQKQIIGIMDEHPEFDIVDITKKMSIDILRSVEMSAQEAAWYLLREPMAKSSVATVYIPTVLPTERARIRTSMKKIEAIDDDCTNSWRENWFDKYEKRPKELHEITLAQFVAKYYQNKKGNYSKRDTARIIRYRNYDMADNYNDYRREMVLLHVPFQSEENDIIAENKFIQIYEDNKDTILERRKEFESNFDIEKTLEMYIQLCQENDGEQEDEEDKEILRAVDLHQRDPYDVSPRDPLFQKLNPSTNHDPLEFCSGFIKCEVEHVSVDNGRQTEIIAVKEELPDVCETQDDIIEPKEEYQSDDLEAENQDNTGLAIEDMHPQPSDSDSESDVPLTKIKIEVGEHIKIEVEEHNIKIEVEAHEIKTEVDQQIAEGTNRSTVAKKEKLDTQRSKQEDTNTAELEENKQSNLKLMETTQNRTSRSDTYDKKPDQRSLYQVEDFRGDTSKDICEKKDKIDSHYNLGNKKHLTERSGIHTGERLFSCDVCQRSFRIKKYLIQHIRIHTGEKSYKCELCQCSFARNGSLKSHMFKHSGEKPYKCEICPRSFTRSGDLKTHLLKHSVEKLHKCDICRRSFKRNYDLRKHILIHTGETPFKCNVCSRSFSRETHLTTHLRIHTGEKPFKCEICQRSFSDTSNLKTHIRIHTGATYKCDICQRSFTRSDNLKNHVRTHTGETPFKCNVCRRSFTRNDDLKSHILIHTGVKSYMCDVCPRSFTLKCNLIKHKRLHTGEKPFKCDICQQSFSRKHHLKIHIPTHTGEKPYKCNVCPSSFTRKGNLLKHTTKHTGK